MTSNNDGDNSNNNNDNSNDNDGDDNSRNDYYDSSNDDVDKNSNKYDDNNNDFDIDDDHSNKLKERIQPVIGSLLQILISGCVNCSPYHICPNRKQITL